MGFTTLFLMREKAMTLDQIAIWYALILGVGVSAGIFLSGRLVDRFAAALSRRIRLPPRDRACDSGAVLHWLRSCAELAGRARVSRRADVPQLLLSDARSDVGSELGAPRDSAPSRARCSCSS